MFGKRVLCSWCWAAFNVPKLAYVTRPFAGGSARTQFCFSGYKSRIGFFFGSARTQFWAFVLQRALDNGKRASIIKALLGADGVSPPWSFPRNSSCWKPKLFSCIHLSLLDLAEKKQRARIQPVPKWYLCNNGEGWTHMERGVPVGRMWNILFSRCFEKVRAAWFVKNRMFLHISISASFFGFSWKIMRSYPSNPRTRNEEVLQTGCGMKQSKHYLPFHSISYSWIIAYLALETPRITARQTALLPLRHKPSNNLQR